VPILRKTLSLMPLSALFLNLTPTRDGRLAETLRLLPQKGRRKKQAALALPPLPTLNLQYSEVPFYEHVRGKAQPTKISD
jgi:hypothetical protein